MRESVIFVNPGELRASCALIGWWERPLAELLIESHAWGMFGNMADDGLMGFMGWCLTQDQKPGTFHIESVPGLPWGQDDFDPWDWYERFVLEVALWDPPPILVNLDEMSITHRGQVLFPPPERRHAVRKDPRVRTSASLFPVGWFGQDLGDLRPGPSTYNCYGPDELPPIRARLTGSFEWLAATPEQEHSFAPDPQSIAKALEKLLALHAQEIPATDSCANSATLE